jgi:hypothetical protein
MVETESNDLTSGQFCQHHLPDLQTIIRKRHMQILSRVETHDIVVHNDATTRVRDIYSGAMVVYSLVPIPQAGGARI